jgi:hypothetical protein
VNRERGDVLGTGELQASILNSVSTRGSRVALRFGGSLRAVVDLREQKIFDRAPDPGGTAFYDEPFVWFGDDELLSCEHDPEADWHRPCRRFERVALADPSKWLTEKYNLTFQFAKMH